MAKKSPAGTEEPIILPAIPAMKKPRGRGGLGGTTLRDYPLFEDIDEYLRARYSSLTILRLLQWQYGDDLEQGRIPPLPSARTLDRYRAAEIPEADLLPRRLIEARLEGLNKKVDLFKSLEELYITAEERVARALQTEDSFNMPVPGTDKAYETVLAVAEQLWKIGQEIGVYPRHGRTFVALSSGGALIATEDPTDEQIELVAAVLYHQRTGRMPPSFYAPAPQIIDGVAELGEP